MKYSCLKLKNVHLFLFNAKCKCSPQSIGGWVQCEYLCLDVSLWYQVIRISVYTLRPPARPPAVQRQLARLRGKIQKFNIKRKLRPSSLHLHHCAVLEEADEYKTKKRKGKEKDARNVQKCSFFSINTHFLILYFFVK